MDICGHLIRRQISDIFNTGCWLTITELVLEYNNFIALITEPIIEPIIEANIQSVNSNADPEKKKDSSKFIYFQHA